MRKSRVLVIALAALSAVAFTTPRLMTWLTERYILQLQQRGIKLSVDDLSGHLVGVAAARVNVWLPIHLHYEGSKMAIPVSLALDHVRVSLGVSTSPLQIPAIRLSATAYGGTIAGTVSNIWDSPSVDLNLREVDLSQHPQLRPAGLESGVLSARLEKLPLDAHKLQTTTLWVSVKDGSFAAPDWIASRVNISSVQDASFETTAVVRENGLFSVGPLTLDSSLLKITGEGRGRLGATRSLLQLSSLFRVQLVGADGERAAQWLPLLTNSELDASDTSFSCAIQDSLCTSKAPLLRLGSTCLKVHYGATDPS